MPRIARSIQNHILSSSSLVLLVVAALCAVVAQASSATNSSILLEQIEICLADARAVKDQRLVCDALDNDTLLNGIDSSLRGRLQASTAEEGFTKDQLVGLANYMRSITPVEQTELGAFDADSLNKIISDYSFEQGDETISLSTRFWQWVAEKLRESGMQDRLDSFGDSFSIDPDQRALIRKIFTWGMGGALLVALLFFFWTLWRYLDPAFRRRRMNLEKSGSTTGADRGDTPVMSLSEIRKLPTNRQPSALLVACLDRLRGRELPDDVWKFTNREIAAKLKRENSESVAPIARLITIAELTLYGERQASADEVDGCFDAADRILDAGATTR